MVPGFAETATLLILKLPRIRGAYSSNFYFCNLGRQSAGPVFLFFPVCGHVRFIG